MKKFISTGVFLFICCVLFGQYKKANVFTKEGRTYGLGTRYYAFGDGRKGVLGYQISFGSDQDGKQLFYSWDFSLIPSYTFSYQTSDYNDDPITITGTSKTQLNFSVNYGYFLIPNEGDQVFKPYVSAGINVSTLNGVKSFDDNNTFGFKKYPEDGGLNMGIGAGLGGFLALGSLFSIKIEGGYNYQHNFNLGGRESGPVYLMYPSHPYGSIGIRYRVTN